MQTDTTTKASVKYRIHHNIRELEITVDMVPAMKKNQLMSASKFENKNYIIVLKQKGVLNYVGNELKLRAS